ncbi:hypothetical protein Dimus_021184 [Dionaea muscipula]
MVKLPANSLTDDVVTWMDGRPHMHVPGLESPHSAWPLAWAHTYAVCVEVCFDWPYIFLDKCSCPHSLFQSWSCCCWHGTTQLLVARGQRDAAGRGWALLPAAEELSTRSCCRRSRCLHVAWRKPPALLLPVLLPCRCPQPWRRRSLLANVAEGYRWPHPMKLFSACCSRGRGCPPSSLLDNGGRCSPASAARRPHPLLTKPTARMGEELLGCSTPLHCSQDTCCSPTCFYCSLVHARQFERWPLKYCMLQCFVARLLLSSPTSWIKQVGAYMALSWPHTSFKEEILI